MAAAAPPSPPATPTLRGVQPLRAGEGHSFFWRKLHSLTGIVPIGAFLIEHIVSNFETLNGPLAYAQQVKFLNSLPLVRVLEWTLIFIPLAYHAIYGVFIAIRGRSNVNVYPWAGNWMYLSQRVTGIIALLYIAYHVWTQRFSGVSLPEHPGAAFHKVQAELANPIVLAVYIIAMIATTWHFAYGIWLFAAKWGITPGEKARKKFGYVCAIVGIALCLMGLASIYAVVTAPEAPEDVMPDQTAGISLPAPTTAPPSSTNLSQTGDVQ
ncbi:succinate dehydrogenase subunit C [Edaphobacter aggregans]|uniref:Succinate dehydrogenase subunit C n=1 Tax=Edaphobacter aggregans TaxID=570835 RepID=A0A3R9NVX3_9BACT|nr:succinate dehydrogenase [Edaphobacter aggregans]RSL14928.1 succinate dehydrogenase subunit C [Edaphobacter aggregans]